MACHANGTIDLRTGGLRRHDPNDLITRLAPVGHNPEARCPAWEMLLGRIMQHDEGLIHYLQQAADMP